MAARSPTPETIQVINRILSVRNTSPGELAQVIATIGDALANLANPPPITLPPRPVAIRSKVVAVRAKKRGVTRPGAPSPTHRSPAASRAEELPRRRGRPRRVASPVEVVPIPPAQPAAQPKLLRRAEVIAPESEHRVVETHSLTQPPKSTIRGVVKWFDSRAGKGAVRLTGISGDLMLDTGLLSRSGIKRLYKDQEIEATVEDTSGRVSILSLALPGRATPPSGGKSGDGAGLRHQRRQVMIEVKQDNSRQKSARAEAEQLLANVGGTKTSRMTSP